MPSYGEYTEYIGVNISEEMKEGLEEAAKKKYSNLSSVVREAIAKFLKENDENNNRS